MNIHSLRRLATCLLMVLSALMAGCIGSDKPLIKDTGAMPPGLNGTNFVNVCERGSVCLVYWINSTSRGALSGGQIIYREKHLLAFEALGDGRHWIAQSSAVDGAHPVYALVREERGTWTAYDFAPNRISADYLQGLADARLIELTKTSTLYGRSVDVKLANRAGLLRWMHDMAKVSSAELEKMASPSVISVASASQVQAFVKNTNTSFSHAIRPDLTGDLERMPLTISSGGCPKDLPSTISCTQYSRPPADLVAPIGPIEVLYFYRDDCGHCRRVTATVAEWHLRLPDGVAFVRHVANTKPTGAPSASLGAYDLNRVPALVINRKFKIELDASDPDTVKIALDLALRLAGEFKR